ncbi:hypothetical protein OSB04_014180 [Centaurea solstitialis]|uniref:Uncharacterized protein n=1 Tax=Centaurea solstitialis TaxID=347529 RepID=A0AA38T8M4_9ASTR|nr:hypothetical protein OSB04_014180 [Centaurea solstitialis]
MELLSNTPAYWFNWRVFLCFLFLLTPIYVASYIIRKYERPNVQRSRNEEEEEDEGDTGVLFEHELWKTCWRKIHPAWLMGYRIFAFIMLLLFIALDVAVCGWSIFYSYSEYVSLFQAMSRPKPTNSRQLWGLNLNMTPLKCLSGNTRFENNDWTKWTLTLLIIYFGVSLLASSKSHTPLVSFYLAFFNWISISKILFFTIYVHGVLFDQLGSYISINGRYRELSRDGSGDLGGTRTYRVVGFVFQIIYQILAGAVVLTDCVYYYLNAPYLATKSTMIFYYLGILRHSINVVFLLGDAVLNSMVRPTHITSFNFDYDPESLWFSAISIVSHGIFWCLDMRFRFFPLDTSRIHPNLVSFDDIIPHTMLWSFLSSSKGETLSPEDFPERWMKLETVPRKTFIQKKLKEANTRGIPKEYKNVKLPKTCLAKSQNSPIRPKYIEPFEPVVLKVSSTGSMSKKAFTYQHIGLTIGASTLQHGRLLIPGPTYNVNPAQNTSKRCSSMVVSKRWRFLPQYEGSMFNVYKILSKNHMLAIVSGGAAATRGEGCTDGGFEGNDGGAGGTGGGFDGVGGTGGGFRGTGGGADGAGGGADGAKGIGGRFRVTGGGADGAGGTGGGANGAKGIGGGFGVTGGGAEGTGGSFGGTGGGVDSGTSDGGGVIVEVVVMDVAIEGHTMAHATIKFLRRIKWCHRLKKDLNLSLVVVVVVVEVMWVVVVLLLVVAEAVVVAAEVVVVEVGGVGSHKGGVGDNPFSPVKYSIQIRNGDDQYSPPYDSCGLGFMEFQELGPAPSGIQDGYSGRQFLGFQMGHNFLCNKTVVFTWGKPLVVYRMETIQHKMKQKKVSLRISFKPVSEIDLNQYVIAQTLKTSKRVALQIASFLAPL